MACQEGFNSILKILLVHGADPNLLSEVNNRRTHPAAAAALRDRSRCVKLLLKNGASLSVMERSEPNPLVVAAERGSVDSLRLLIDFGFNVNTRVDIEFNGVGSTYHYISPLFNRQYATPLGRAASKGSLACINILLQAGQCILSSFFMLRDNYATALHCNCFRSGNDFP